MGKTKSGLKMDQVQLGKNLVEEEATYLQKLK